MWVSGSGLIICETLGLERARESKKSQMQGGIQSLVLIFYSKHVHFSLHLSVPSNNSPGLAACLPASLVNHAVFASDLAKIVAGPYIYLYIQLGCRKGKRQSRAFWHFSLQTLCFISAVTHSHFFPLASLSTSLSSAFPSIFNISLFSYRQNPDIATATCKDTHMHTQRKPVA